MPLWVWAFLILMISFSSFRLIAAWQSGVVKAGPFRYKVGKEPIYFWLLIVTYIIILGYCAWLILAVLRNMLA